MKELKTKKEAVDFVFNQLHTCRVIDTTWDEYIELTLRLGLENHPRGKSNHDKSNKEININLVLSFFDKIVSKFRN